MICYVLAMGKQHLGPHVVVGYGIKIFWPDLFITSPDHLAAIEETRRSAVIPNREHCCVPQCQNNLAKNIPNLTFHQFPSDKSIRQRWIVKIRRDVGKSFQVSWLGHQGHCAHVITILIMIWSIHR